MSEVTKNGEYKDFITAIKSQVQSADIKTIADTYYNWRNPVGVAPCGYPNAYPNNEQPQSQGRAVAR